MAEPAELVGYCAVVGAGPWEDKPAVFEFWVEPDERMAAFALFEVACAAAGAVEVATQLNAPLLPALMHAYCVQVTTESIVFEDKHPTLRLEPPPGTRRSQLRSLTSADDTAAAMAKRRGGCEFSLHAEDGCTIATGGILFHYNPVGPGRPPYGDIYYEVVEERRGQVHSLRSCTVLLCTIVVPCVWILCCVERLDLSLRLLLCAMFRLYQRWSGYFVTLLKEACCELSVVFIGVASIARVSAAQQSLVVQ